MSSRGNRRAAQLRQRATTVPGRVAALNPDQARAFAQAGAGFITPHEAALIANSAVMLAGQSAPQMAALVGAGAALAAIDEVVTRLCGPPPDPAQPFAALPEWAVALFKRVGIIRPPAPVEDPNAPPKAIESQQELLERAAKAGIVLA